MASARRIVVEFLGDGKSLSGELNNLESKTSGWGSAMGKVGKVGMVAGAALAAGAVIGGKALFDMGQKAGDLNETISKTNQIFGSKAGKQLQIWAEDTDKQLGMSKQTALDAAATFGTFGKAAGKSGQDLRAFAQQNTALAADLASFNNTSPEQAIEAIGAALRGESEPIRAYGVMLDDASMRQEALSMGLVKTTKEALTPQQKVLAAQSLIMQKTSDAQGDFSRTSDGLANQQRILSAQFENVQASVGQKMLPILLTLAKFANETLIPALGQVGDWINTNVVPPLQKLGQQVMTAVVPALKQMGDWIQQHVLPVFQQLGNEGPSIFNKVKDVIGAVVPVVLNIVRVVAQNLKPVFEQLVDTIRTALMPTIQKVIERFAEWWPTISKVVTKVWDLASTILGTVLPPIIKLAGVILEKLVPALLDGIEFLAKGIGKAFEFGAAFVDAVKDVGKFAAGVLEKIGNAIGYVRDIPTKVKNALGDLGGILLDAGKAIIQGLINGVTSKIGELEAKFREITGKIPDWKGPADKDAILLKPAGAALIDGLIKGIDEGKVKLQKVLEKLTDFIHKKQDKLATLLDKRRAIIDSFKGMTSSIFSMSMDPTTNEDGSTTPKSVADLLAFQKDQRARAERLSASVKTLAPKLSPDLMRQLLAQGQSGQDQINLLATATEDQIAQANADNLATQQALQAAGMEASRALGIEADIRATERDIKQAEIIKQGLKDLLDQENKNTVVELHLDGHKILWSLKKIKRQNGGHLGLGDSDRD